MKTQIKILLILNLVVCCSIFGQRSTKASVLLDSISNKVSYKANPLEIIKLSKKLLKAGEREKDTFLILRALHHLGRRNQFANENYKSIKYFNRELLFFTNNLLSQKVKKELKGTEIAPVEIYAQLGNNFSNLGDKKKALEYFNLSKNIAEKEELPFYKAVIPVLIGEIKVSIKEYDQAIKYYKLGLKRLESSKVINEKTKKFNSSITVRNLAHTYLLKKEIDSAKFTLNYGINKGYHTNTKNSELIYSIVKAEILIFENKLNEALEQYKTIENKSNILDPAKGILYYYNGYAKCLAKLGKYKMAIDLMKKGILIRLKEAKDFSLSEDYKQLAKYYKADGNLKKSNTYFEKYVLSQTALEKNKRDVIKEFHDNELQSLNSQKEQQQKITTFLIIGGTVVIILLLLYLFILSKRKKKNTKKFEELLGKIESQEQIQKLVDTKDEVLEEKSTSDISKETFDEILAGIQKIEEQHYYLKQECNSYNVAKKIKTNTSYLSKVINAHYQKNFNTYINDLRINYVILKLKEDSRFRSYSIQSISEDTGYKSTDSFTKYFKRRTGLLPSVYIKKLNSIS